MVIHFYRDNEPEELLLDELELESLDDELDELELSELELLDDDEDDDDDELELSSLEELLEELELSSLELLEPELELEESEELLLDDEEDDDESLLDDDDDDESSAIKSSDDDDDDEELSSVDRVHRGQCAVRMGSESRGNIKENALRMPSVWIWSNRERDRGWKSGNVYVDHGLSDSAWIGSMDPIQRLWVEMDVETRWSGFAWNVPA